MPIHPEIAARFVHLEGLTTWGDALKTPEGREQLDRFETWDDVEPPPTVSTRMGVAPGQHGPVPVRVYEPGNDDVRRPCLMWFHGGGFVGGDLDMREADWTAREVCRRAGAVVVSVDYRLAVDGVHYPVPHDDAVAAISWVRDQHEALRVDPAGLAVGGASAGANLAAGAALKVRDREGWVPSALLLVYPMLHAVLPTPLPSLAAALQELPACMQQVPSAQLNENYLGGPVTGGSGYAFPASGVLEGLPPTLVLNAEYDQLRASGESFAAGLALAGVDVRQVLVPGVPHGFLNMPAALEPVSMALDLMAEATRTGTRTPRATTDHPISIAL